MLIIYGSIAMIWIVFFYQGNFFLCLIQVTLKQAKILIIKYCLIRNNLTIKIGIYLLISLWKKLFIEIGHPI